MKLVRIDNLQLAIMKVIWANDGVTVLDIKEKLVWNKELAATTIGTVLKRLEEKEVIGHRKEGRQFIFFARKSQDEIKTQATHKLLREWFKGDSFLLVNHLLEETELKPGEIEKIQSLLDQHKSKK